MKAPVAIEIDTAGAVALVYSANLARRQLSKSQLAMAGAKLKAWHAARAKERQLASLKKGAAPVMANLPEREAGTARDHAAKAVGVCGKLIDQAENVMRKAVPEVAQLVESGATVTELRPRPDPMIAEVVRLMEETDEAGRVKVLEAVKAVLAFYDPPEQRVGKIIRFSLATYSARELGLEMAELPPWLTDEEVDELCFPLVQPAAQIRYLDHLGLQPKRKPSGKPLVGRRLATAVINGESAVRAAPVPVEQQTPVERPSLNKQALLEHLGGSKAKRK